jgi:hypothetical protein
MSITMIGLDTAKSVFQVHGLDVAGQVVICRFSLNGSSSICVLFECTEG